MSDIKQSFFGTFRQASNKFVNFFRIFFYGSHNASNSRDSGDSERLWVVFSVSRDCFGKEVAVTAIEVVECLRYLQDFLFCLRQANSHENGSSYGQKCHKWPEPIKILRKRNGGNADERNNGKRVCQLRDQMIIATEKSINIFFGDHWEPPVKDVGLGNPHSVTSDGSRQFWGQS